jgi:transcription elongation factor GreA
MLRARRRDCAANIDRIRTIAPASIHGPRCRKDRRKLFQLVMPEDADATKGLISTTSPIGRAFLNKEPGDSVKVETPGGKREFEIVKLFTIHDEAAG